MNQFPYLECLHQIRLDGVLHQDSEGARYAKVISRVPVLACHHHGTKHVGQPCGQSQNGHALASDGDIEANLPFVAPLCCTTLQRNRSFVSMTRFQVIVWESTSSREERVVSSGDKSSGLVRCRASSGVSASRARIRVGLSWRVPNDCIVPVSNEESKCVYNPNLVSLC
jgi:hypothetical protein